MKYQILDLRIFLTPVMYFFLTTSCSRLNGNGQESLGDLNEFIFKQCSEMVVWEHQITALPRAIDKGLIKSVSDQNFRKLAKEILTWLSFSDYRVKLTKNYHFLLKNYSGSSPYSEEIVVLQNYANYYFLKAMYRLNQETNS
jgi:hypothetical protein